MDPLKYGFANRNARLLAEQVENFRGQPDGVRPNGPARGNAVATLNRQDLLFNGNTLQPMADVPAEEINFIADNMRYGDFLHIPFTVGTTGNQTPILTRPQGKRVFLCIENTHSTNDLFVGFGIVPSATIGITIPAGGNLFLDNFCPQNDVYLAGSGAATTGKITYANQEYGKS